VWRCFQRECRPWDGILEDEALISIVSASRIARWRTPVPVILLLLSAFFLRPPALASGQTFSAHVSAGPTVTDAGYSFAGGLGFSPAARVTLAANVERTHLFSRSTSDGRGGFSSFRGGTLTLGSAELQVAPRGRNRVGPYGLVGFAAGQSRPNVNATFPNPVVNEARAVFFGGGVIAPIGERLSIFIDARMMIGAEGIEGIVAVAPIRAGIGWRF
jgi:hypothetical protein